MHLNTYEVIITGYFNINLFEKNEERENFLDLLHLYVCITFSNQFLRKTRVTHRTATLINNIFVNLSHPFDHQFLDTALSDYHAQIILIKNIYSRETKSHIKSSQKIKLLILGKKFRKLRGILLY